MGGNIPDGNFLGGNFPGGIFQGGVWWVGIFLGGIFLEPIITVKVNIFMNETSILVFAELVTFHFVWIRTSLGKIV